MKILILAGCIGIVLSLLLIFSAKFTRFDRDVSFYPSILIFIASFYILFAVMAGHSIVRETSIAFVFILFALYGAYKSLFVVGLAIALHGVYDILHYLQFTETVAPSWWAPFCAAVDFVVGIWVMYLSKKQVV
ncbi:hypothetical protein ISG33_02690 [Glaciecola sp. MH2013]|uniref:DUF6010 family protein n=1 Tax=Glaciecola sp. MH2013 TaxID=2785524 RepID=UPI00189FBC94|nr:DUF6010 family protein [Glaciecola sp. MH2013]MBF7072310.1 hypothetical protein [Glaciecola sp. MH2013]